MGRRYQNILETIGNTPVVRLNKMGPDHVDLYVKVESFNPMASVKDRLAFAIINDAEQRGTLQPVERRDIFAPLPGKVMKVLVKHGDSVEVGQVLAFVGAVDAVVGKGEAEHDGVHTELFLHHAHHRDAAAFG